MRISFQPPLVHCIYMCVHLFWLINFYLWLVLVILFSKIYYGFTPLQDRTSRHYTSRHIEDLPWDTREWCWRNIPMLGDVPFFWYTFERRYKIHCKPVFPISMGLNFIQEMNLITIFYQQILAKFWHNVKPKKVGTLIWLIFNKGFLMGSWL